MQHLFYFQLLLTSPESIIFLLIFYYFSRFVRRQKQAASVDAEGNDNDANFDNTQDRDEEVFNPQNFQILCSFVQLIMSNTTVKT